jgi:hypothetical protein
VPPGKCQNLLNSAAGGAFSNKKAAFLMLLFCQGLQGLRFNSEIGAKRRALRRVSINQMNANSPRLEPGILLAVLNPMPAVLSRYFRGHKTET